MVERQRKLNAVQEAKTLGRVFGAPATLTGAPVRAVYDPDARRYEHPGVLKSMIPIWGSGKEALADFEDRNYGGAAVNAGLAISDVVLAKALLSGLTKGGLKVAGPHVWRKWEKSKAVGEKAKATGMRPWLVERDFVKKGQPAHHWAFEQRTSVPDFVKNQAPFVKPMKDAVQHGRIHGRYTKGGVTLPRYNAPQRLWYGTPQWAKAGYISSAGHGGTAAGQANAAEDELSHTRR
jgi:hypothetical protein